MAAFDFAGPSALIDGDTKNAAARTVSAVRAAKRVLFMIVTSLESYCFPSVDCLGLCIAHDSCQWPRPRPPRTGFCTNYLLTDGLFFAASAEEYRRDVFATAVTLSDRIVRLSDQLGVMMEHDRREQIEPMGNLIETSQIGAYQLLSPLGRGGMGEVHLALDTRLGRKVAIKLLPAAFTTDAGRVRRFAQEARAASALNHPNIITIYEIGEAQTDEGNTHYIVTEDVDGVTLRHRMEKALQGRFSLAEALDVAAQIAAALATAHEAGIVHRDIKPENVMVRRDGIVKVLDFGLAKLTEPASPVIDSQAPTLVRNITEDGIVMGTPRYMSPEQARGEKADARTDIFSLGVTLYEMLAGRPPFGGTTPSEVIASILRDTPTPLAELATDAPRDIG